MNEVPVNVAILVPTLNGGEKWAKLLESISQQSVQIQHRCILDSGSADNTVELARQYGFFVSTIEKKDFDHGYARQLLSEKYKEFDILLYLTQDCILADKNSVGNLLSAFDDPSVGIAYGRQLPHSGATLLEKHARSFNYPSVSKVKSYDDRKEMGIKTASCSNSFAAYRRRALEQIGGFPLRSIFGEDVIVAGKMLMQGWKIAYIADAQAYHSHDYTPLEEFKRYFDIGVFHKTNEWLLNEYGKAEGEGMKFVRSELKTVFRNNCLLFPKMITSTVAKLIGYKLGLMHEKIPIKMRFWFSMHRAYWAKQINIGFSKFSEK